MFKQRVITASVLLVGLMCQFYYGSIMSFYAISGVFFIVMAWEWSRLIPLTSPLSVALFIGWLVALIYPAQQALMVWFGCSVVLWFGVIVALGTYPTTAAWWDARWLIGVLGGVWLPLFFVTWVLWYQHSPAMLLYVCCVVWMTDTGAYLAGKRFGAQRLLPAVSPGKTQVGALAGFMAAQGVVWIGFYFTEGCAWWLWLVANSGVIIWSMLGDLAISLLKRRCGLKDTGSFLPGHGGVLDRVDSLLPAVAFFYVVFVQMLG